MCNLNCRPLQLNGQLSESDHKLHTSTGVWTVFRVGKNWNNGMEAFNIYRLLILFLRISLNYFQNYFINVDIKVNATFCFIFSSKRLEFVKIRFVFFLLIINFFLLQIVDLLIKLVLRLIKLSLKIIRLTFYFIC